MKTLQPLTLTLIAIAACNLSVRSQTLRPVQYASSVIAFSSEYNPSPANYSATRALGAPDVYPACGSNVNAWTSLTQNGQREFLVLGFSAPQPVNTIRIWQTVAPGAIDTIYLRDAATNAWNTVYTATAAAPGDGTQCPGLQYMLLEVTIPTTAYNVNAIRIAVNSPAVTSYWNEIDAVGVANFDVMPENFTQYATSVLGFSSEYGPSPGNYSAQRALGAPNVPDISCGTHPNAWASLTQNGQREHLVVGYAYPAPINRVSIVQNTAPGAVDTVYLRNAATGVWNTVYSAPAAAVPCPSGKLLEINFTKTPYSVDAVRIAINSPAVASYWNEIDAIGIRAALPTNAVLSAQDGPWNATATWQGGVLPAANDTVLIGATHDVTVDVAGAVAKGLYITSSGNVIVGSAGALTVGPAGGGASKVEVSGGIQNGGTLNINGSVRFNAASSFAMTAGTLNIDGNSGTIATSVPDSIYHFDALAGMANFSFAGGTMTFVDPAIGANGRTVRSLYNFGPLSTLRLGNGSSTTAGGNAAGFILTPLATSIGSLVVNTATGGTRQVTVGDALTVQKSCTVTSGNIVNNSNLNILGP